MFHFLHHRWTVVAVDHYENGLAYTKHTPTKTVITGMSTLVLQRCVECNAVRSTELPGVWTLKQLREKAA